MRRNRLARFPFAALLVASGCVGSRDPMPVRHYLPAPPAAAAADAEALALSLAVEDFEAAPHLAGDRIAARVRPSEVEYYSQHRWAGPLDRVVTQEARAYLRPYFAAVLDGAASESSDLVLSGRIERFEEEDDGGAWHGRAVLSLTLARRGAEAPLWTGVLESRQRAASRNPGAVAAALGAALGDTLQRAVLDWRRILSEGEKGP